MEFNKLSTYVSEYDEDVYWLALEDKESLIPTLDVIKYFVSNDSLKGLYHDNYLDLIAIAENNKNIGRVTKYASSINFSNIKYNYDKLKKEKINIIKYTDFMYPDLLRKIPNPPLLLFKMGKHDISDNCVAMAGTRNPSHYGRKMARKIAYDLAKRGVTIVSGMAHGIDEWAHNGALEAPKGKTIAVLAWMKPEYPKEHIQLHQDILKRGSIISELYLRPESRMAQGKFIQRNRITSGLSHSVIAVESDETGGTVHQVKIALAQGKTVFALEPKSNKRAKRGFEVFKELGAIPIKSSKQILQTLETKLAQLTIQRQKAEQKTLDTVGVRH